MIASQFLSSEPQFSLPNYYLCSMRDHAIIFDMDGVIAHTNPYHTKAFERFFDKYNVSYNLADFEEHMYGKHNSYIMRHFFKRDIPHEEFINLEMEKEGIFRELYSEEAEAIAGFVPFLHKLRENQFKTAVATSAPKANLDLIVDRLGIRKYMDSILTAEDVTKHKPDPQVYLKSADILGVPPENCLVFEDSYTGVTAGQAAGMEVVAVLSTHSKDELPPCKYYIDDYTNLPLDDLYALLK